MDDALTRPLLDPLTTDTLSVFKARAHQPLSKETFCMKTRISIVLTAFCLTATQMGCGLDPQNKSAANSSSAPSAAQPTTPSQSQPGPSNAGPAGPELYVEWPVLDSYVAKRKRSILEESLRHHLYKLASPITLPEYMKDSIKLTVKNFKFQAAAKTEILKAMLTTADSPSSAPTQLLSISPSNVLYEEKDGGVSDITLSVSGLKKLFPKSSDEEERAYVTLQFSEKDDDPNPVRISFYLMSPPSKITFEQKSLKAFEASGQKVATELKFLESNSAQLALLQISEVTNRSEQPVAIDLKTRLKGKLWQKSTWTDPQYSEFSKKVCNEDEKIMETTETYSEQFSALPLQNDLPSQWQDFLKNHTNELVILPGETKSIGIYGMPNEKYADGFKTLLDRRSPQTYAKAHPIVMQKIETRCNFTCKKFNTNDSYKNQCDTLPNSPISYQNSCNIMVKSCSRCQSTPASDRWQAGYCNDCFSNEEIYLGFLDDFKPQSVCQSEWEKTVLETTTAKKGTELGPIYLNLDSASSLFEVRYANAPKAEDPESRSVYAILESAIQDQ